MRGEKGDTGAGERTDVEVDREDGIKDCNNRSSVQAAL